MNQGQFSTSLKDCWQLLKSLDLNGTENLIQKTPDNPANLFKEKTYVEIYKICFENFYYRFLLSDGSMIQIDGLALLPAKIKLRYAFYESPYKSVTFEEYAANSGLLEGLEDGTEESVKELYTMYEEDISSIAYSTLKKQAFSIRYDYSEREYKEGLHPVSHFHFGHNNNVRIATKKVLSPMSFCLLVVRQCYPDSWLKFHDLPNAEFFLKNIRDNLNDVHQDFWNSKDNSELYLV